MVARTIDAKLRKVGNSYVITVPIKVVQRFKIKEGDFLEVIIRKLRNKR